MLLGLFADSVTTFAKETVAICSPNGAVKRGWRQQSAAAAKETSRQLVNFFWGVYTVYIIGFKFKKMQSRCLFLKKAPKFLNSFVLTNYG